MAVLLLLLLLLLLLQATWWLRGSVMLRLSAPWQPHCRLKP
jgi:hypothetical protein